MMNFALAAVPLVMKLLMGIWILAALILVLIVLIQKGKGGGLSAAFGGIGSSLLGTKTGDFLTWVTISIVGVWLLLSVVAAKWFKPTASEFLRTESAPISAPAPKAETQTAEQPAETQQPAAAETNAPAAK
ncbi:MAG: preprotein translocase subunit SecG [Phycisphaerae bacterium]|jgi:preprotein translocase subunit SecG